MRFSAMSLGGSSRFRLASQQTSSHGPVEPGLKLFLFLGSKFRRQSTLPQRRLSQDYTACDIEHKNLGSAAAQLQRLFYRRFIFLP
jgi:hypothetical protein